MYTDEHTSSSPQSFSPVYCVSCGSILGYAKQQFLRAYCEYCYDKNGSEKYQQGDKNGYSRGYDEGYDSGYENGIDEGEYQSQFRDNK